MTEETGRTHIVANGRRRSGILDARASGCFLRLEDGRIAFYPSGPLGRIGYVLRSTDQELTLRVRMRERARAWMVFNCVLIFVLSLGGFYERSLAWPFWVWLLVFCGIECLILASNHLAYRYITRGLPRSPVPNRPILQWQRVGAGHSLLFLCSQCVVGLAFLGVGIYLFVTTRHPLWIVYVGSFAWTFVPWSISAYGWWADRRGIRIPH